jgi:hypothetical protein
LFALRDVPEVCLKGSPEEMLKRFSGGGPFFGHETAEIQKSDKLQNKHIHY